MQLPSSETRPYTATRSTEKIRPLHALGTLYLEAGGLRAQFSSFLKNVSAAAGLAIQMNPGILMATIFTDSARVGEVWLLPAVGIAPDPFFFGYNEYQLVGVFDQDTPDHAHWFERAALILDAESRRRVRESMKVLKSTAEKLRSDRLSVGNGLVVFRDHMLLEKIPLVEALLGLGLEPNRLWVLPKRDFCLHRSRVAASLRSLGANVYEQTVEDFARFAADTLRDAPITVMDDGGELIVALARTLPEGTKWAAIETTTKGSTHIRRHLPSFQFTDLSKSAIKSDSSLAIAVSCVTSLRSILRHERIVGERAVVLGFGAIGEHVAILLRAFGMIVAVADVDEIRSTHAVSHGFASFLSCEAALEQHRPTYVIGCSGARSLNANHLPLLADAVILASVSSQDLKDLMTHLDSCAHRQEIRGLGSVFNIDRHRIVCVADGDAVNLYYSEGVAEPEFDKVTSIFLSSIVMVAQLLRTNRHFDVAEMASVTTDYVYAAEALCKQEI